MQSKTNLSSNKCFKAINFYTSAPPVLYLLTILIRTRHSISYFPADPGYELVRQALEKPLTQIFSDYNWQYFYVIPRFLCEIVILFPVKFHALVMGILINLVWVLCALFIKLVISQTTSSNRIGLVSGLILMLSPVASESSLGNYGNVKWPLTVLIVVCFTSQELVTNKFKWLIPLTIAIGLSTPLLFVCIIPLMINQVKHKFIEWRKSVSLIMICLATSMAQVFASGGLSSAAKGWGSSRIYSLSGLGKFWWFGQTAPILFSLAAILGIYVNKNLARDRRSMILGTSLSAITIALLSFYLGGVADRYFTAPLTLSLIALLISLTINPWKKTSLISRIITTLLLVVILVPTVKWFDAGWYLTSGPTWMSEVKKATQVCSDGQFTEVSLHVSPSGMEVLNCKHLSNP
jgi:hypothetical protein